MTYKYEIKPYFKIPKRLKKTPLLTAKQILMATSPKTVKNSSKVAIQSVDIRPAPAAFLEGYFKYKLDTHNVENGHNYRVTLFVETPIIKANTKVIIDSPNPLWVYTYEYAMAKRGNAFIYRCNGDAPIIKNPRLKAGVDHHVYAALKYLIKSSKSIYGTYLEEKEKAAKAKAKNKTTSKLSTKLKTKVLVKKPVNKLKAKTKRL